MGEGLVSSVCFCFFGELEDLLGLKAIWNLQSKSGFLKNL